MDNIHEIISDNIKSNKPCVMMVITNKQGSIPQSIGSIMVVEENNTYGSIGGGSLEACCIEKAYKIMEDNDGVSFSEHYNLCEKPFNMICGGNVEIMYTYYSKKEQIHVFGSGHIALAISKVVDNLGIDAIFYDDRPEMLKKFKKSVLVDYSDLDLEGLTPYIIVATRGYEQDFKVVDYVKDRDFEYLGILGSSKKRAKLFSVYEFENKDKIYMPAGLKISNQEPNEIAISIISEILQIKNKLKGGHARD